MSNGKETNEYITQEYAYVSDKGIQTQDYFKELRRVPDTDARQLRDVEPALNGNNETLMDKPIAVVYEEIFGDAARKYNAKYEGKNMSGTAYLERQEKAKSKNIAYDMTVCVGNSSDANHKGQCVEREILKSYLADFVKRNKQIEVIGAFIHGDEKNKPVHLHIIYVPWADGYTAGMSRQFSLAGALKAYRAQQEKVPDSEMKCDWGYAERRALEAVGKKYKVKIEWPELIYGYGSQEYIEKYRAILAPKKEVDSKPTTPNSKIVYMKWTTTYTETIDKIRSKAAGMIPCGDEVPIDVSLEDVYERVFGNAAREYTWRHPENPQSGRSYLQKQIKSKKTIAMIMTVQIGTIKDTPHGDDEAERKILKEYAINFIRAHASFEVIGVYIHGNEEGKALHLHILFVPWGDGFKKDLYRQFSLNKALERDGFAQNENAESDCFTQYELNTLRELCEKHGIAMQPIWTMRATDQYKYFGSPAWMQMEAEGHPYYEENLNRVAY